MASQRHRLAQGHLLACSLGHESRTQRVRSELRWETGQSSPLKDDVAHSRGRQRLANLLAAAHASEDWPLNNAGLANPGVQRVGRVVEDGLLAVPLLLLKA